MSQIPVVPTVSGTSVDFAAVSSEGDPYGPGHYGLRFAPVTDDVLLQGLPTIDQG